MFQAKVVEKIKNTYFVFSNFFFFQNRAGFEIMCKNYCTAGQGTDGNMALARGVLST